MIVVDSVEQADGKWITEQIRLLTAPRQNNETGQWTALANYYGMLAIIELKITPQHSEGLSK